MVVLRSFDCSVVEFIGAGVVVGRINGVAAFIGAGVVVGCIDGVVAFTRVRLLVLGL